MAQRVLVVDDDDTIREFLREGLESEGFVVTAVGDGVSAVEHARAEPPDIVVCDVAMPGMDGHAVLATLQQSSATAAIPFVFLTGEGTRADQRRGMESGADDYLVKPAKLSEVIAAVHTRLAKHEAARRQAENALDELRASMTRLFPHEMLTPLTPIVGYAALLRAEGHSYTRAELAQMGTDIEASAARLERMVRNILFYAGLEILRAAPDVALLRGQRTESVRAAVEAGLRRAAARFRRQGDVRLEAPDASDARVAMPPSHLEAIVEELVDNACKFSTPGTAVEVSLHGTSDTVRLTVTDHGRGMSGEDMARIGAYLQFDRARFEQQGVGLGLIIVKRVAELAGGQLTLRCGANGGLAAEVVLPRSSR